MKHLLLCILGFKILACLPLLAQHSMKLEQIYAKPADENRKDIYAGKKVNLSYFRNKKLIWVKTISQDFRQFKNKKEYDSARIKSGLDKATVWIGNLIIKYDLKTGNIISVMLFHAPKRVNL